jgi:16S rRNA (uracil1498-N3)-methyltransferase
VAHFYLVDDLTEAVAGSTVTVTGAEARHAVTVSRVRTGESLTLGDGRGTVVRGEVVEATGDRLSLVAATVTEHPRPGVRIALAQALAKGDRDELAVQAATELGVDEVVPWSASRSVSRWEGPKVAKGTARWRAITREATKQAVRPWSPEVLDLASTKQLAGRTALGTVLVLEPTAEVALSVVDLPPAGGAGQVVTVVVGPEGGVSPAELALFVEAGATPVRLGDSVLRTSTAGPAALAVLSVRLGRW